MVKKINVAVSEEAKDVLIAYKKQHKYSNLDSALEDLILEYKVNSPEG